jgi:hypothetical protein
VVRPGARERPGRLRHWGGGTRTWEARADAPAQISCFNLFSQAAPSKGSSIVSFSREE